MHAILISGKRCSGKSTLAEALCEYLRGYTRLALADELKADVYDMIFRRHQPVEDVPLSKKVAWIDEHKSMVFATLQEYGTDTCRALFGQDYWVVRLKHLAESTGNLYIAVPDVRFPNELHGFEDGRWSSFSVRLEISPGEQAHRHMEVYGTLPDPRKMAHISETALDDHLHEFDIVLDATLPTLEQVTQIAARLGGGWPESHELLHGLG